LEAVGLAEAPVASLAAAVDLAAEPGRSLVVAAAWEAEDVKVLEAADLAVVAKG
jgi:hypothetical protein